MCVWIGTQFYSREREMKEQCVTHQSDISGDQVNKFSKWIPPRIHRNVAQPCGHRSATYKNRIVHIIKREYEVRFNYLDDIHVEYIHTKYRLWMLIWLLWHASVWVLVMFLLLSHWRNGPLDRVIGDGHPKANQVRIDSHNFSNELKHFVCLSDFISLSFSLCISTCLQERSNASLCHLRPLLLRSPSQSPSQLSPPRASSIEITHLLSTI